MTLSTVRPAADARETRSGADSPPSDAVVCVWRSINGLSGAGTGPALLKIASLDGGDASVFGPADTNGAYATGRVFYKSGAALMAQPFDEKTLTKSGMPVNCVAHSMAYRFCSRITSIRMTKCRRLQAQWHWTVT